jgi:hypothetical protein
MTPSGWRQDADALLVPLIPSTLSERTLIQLKFQWTSVRRS